MRGGWWPLEHCLGLCSPSIHLSLKEPISLFVGPNSHGVATLLQRHPRAVARPPHPSPGVRHTASTSGGSTRCARPASCRSGHGLRYRRPGWRAGRTRALSYPPPPTYPSVHGACLLRRKQTGPSDGASSGQVRYGVRSGMSPYCAVQAAAGVRERWRAWATTHGSAQDADAWSSGAAGAGRSSAAARAVRAGDRSAPAAQSHSPPRRTWRRCGRCLPPARETVESRGDVALASRWWRATSLDTFEPVQFPVPHPCVPSCKPPTHVCFEHCAPLAAPYKAFGFVLCPLQPLTCSPSFILVNPKQSFSCIRNPNPRNPPGRERVSTLQHQSQPAVTPPSRKHCICSQRCPGELTWLEMPLSFARAGAVRRSATTGQTRRWGFRPKSRADTRNTETTTTPPLRTVETAELTQQQPGWTSPAGAEPPLPTLLDSVKRAVDVNHGLIADYPTARSLRWRSCAVVRAPPL